MFEWTHRRGGWSWCTHEEFLMNPWDWGVVWWVKEKIVIVLGLLVRGICLWGIPLVGLHEWRLARAPLW